MTFQTFEEAILSLPATTSINHQIRIEYRCTIQRAILWSFERDGKNTSNLLFQSEQTDTVVSTHNILPFHSIGSYSGSNFEIIFKTGQHWFGSIFIPFITKELLQVLSYLQEGLNMVQCFEDLTREYEKWPYISPLDTPLILRTLGFTRSNFISFLTDAQKTTLDTTVFQPTFLRTWYDLAPNLSTEELLLSKKQHLRKIGLVLQHNQQ